MVSVITLLSDPAKFQVWMKANLKEIIIWLLFLAFIVIVFFCLSDKDFSFFLTLSGSIQMFGFLIIAFRVFQKRSAAGLSLQTFICYMVVFAARLISILRYEGYLPYDSTGDWFYRAGEIVAFLCCGGLIYFIGDRFKSTFKAENDNVKWFHLVPVTFVLALMFHPNLNSNFVSDVAWTFALYLEAVAMFPQIYLFAKTGGEIESYTSHFVASQGFSRISALIFWVYSYHELNDVTGTSLLPSCVGYFVLFAQAVQILLMGDFLYQYVKCLNSGLPMTLPTYNI